MRTAKHRLCRPRGLRDVPGERCKVNLLMMGAMGERAGKRATKGRPYQGTLTSSSYRIGYRPYRSVNTNFYSPGKYSYIEYKEEK
jgi:hypothetical protein